MVASPGLNTGRQYEAENKNKKGDSEMEDLKKLLGNYEGAKLEIQALKKKPLILQEKVDQTSKRRSKLESAIQDAERHKDKTLTAFAIGDASEIELAHARENLDRLMKERNEGEEFLSVSIKANVRIQRDIAELSQKLTGSRHVLFTEIASLLKVELPGDVVLKVNRIYAALNLGGGAGSYGGFLERLFPLAPHAERQKIEEEVKKEFGFIE